MNPNDLSIPELHNLLERKGVNETGEDFYNSLTDEEKRYLRMVESDWYNFSLGLTGVYVDGWQYIFSRLNNWERVLRSIARNFLITDQEDCINMQIFAKKIIQDYNLFLSFQKYVNHKVFLMLQKDIK